MTPEQEEHLRSIKSSFMFAVEHKYRKGQQEHGGNLQSMPWDQLIDNAIDEAIDQYVYLVTLRAQLKESWLKNVKNLTSR